MEGSDLYITGSIASSNTTLQVSSVWKNGQRTSLALPAPHDITYIRATGTDIKVVDGHVYICGTMRAPMLDAPLSPTRAVVWKDGALEVLEASRIITEASGLDVVDGDVYVVGQERSADSGLLGKYWKNGKEVFVTRRAFFRAKIGRSPIISVLWRATGSMEK